MQFNGQSHTLALLISKIFKVIGIKFGFLFPTIFTKIRLTLYGCTFGSNLRVAGKVVLRPVAINTIIIGDNVSLISRFLTNTVGIMNPTVLETIKNGRIEIGSNSGLTSTIVSSRTLVRIGNFVKVGANVRIFDHDFHSLDSNIRRDSSTDSQFTQSAAVVIGDDVFIGTNSIILKGVHIGSGTVIGAGSVVTMKYVPENSFLAGNPARVINPKSLDRNEN